MGKMNHSEEKVLNDVNRFYEKNPFPGFNIIKYSYSEDLRQHASWFGKLLDDQIPYHAKILDAGCGTGLLANFLSLKDRFVLGIDYSQYLCNRSQQSYTAVSKYL